MANNLTLASPEIQATIKWLREKNGLDNKPIEKELFEAERKIKELKSRIKSIERSEEKKEIAYWRESERIESCLRLLTTIHNRDLKRAVSLVLYWDKFSWLTCDIIERMRKHNPRIKAFLDLPHTPGVVRSMERCIERKEFAAALLKFGYGKKAEKRVADKSTKSMKKSKKSTSKKGSK